MKKYLCVILENLLKQIQRMKLLENLLLWLRYFLLSLTLAICNGYFFDWVIKIYNISVGNREVLDISKWEKFWLVCFIAPIIETLVFQFLPVFIISKFIKNENGTIFLIALIFCLFHTYSVVYVCMTFMGGVIMGYFYFKTKKLGFYPIVSTIILHSFYNLYGFLFVDV
jgi:uncharacterized protein